MAFFVEKLQNNTSPLLIYNDLGPGLKNVQTAPSDGLAFIEWKPKQDKKNSSRGWNYIENVL